MTREDAIKRVEAATKDYLGTIGQNAPAAVDVLAALGVITLEDPITKALAETVVRRGALDPGFDEPAGVALGNARAQQIVESLAKSGFEIVPKS